MEKFKFDNSLIFYLNINEYNYKRSKLLYDYINNNFNISDNPNECQASIVIGGDGSLLKVVRDPVLVKMPILAINGGTVGKTLMDLEEKDISDFFNNFFRSSLCDIFEFPMLKVEITDVMDNKYTKYAFNDLWVDRLDSQTIRYNIDINNNDNNKNLISGDGILFSTSIGSTGYFRMLCDKSIYDFSNAMYSSFIPFLNESILIAPMSSMINYTKEKLDPINVDKNSIIKVDLVDYDYREARIAVEGLYLKDDTDDYLKVKSFTVSLCSREEASVKLILKNIKDLENKHLNFTK